MNENKMEMMHNHTEMVHDHTKMMYDHMEMTMEPGKGYTSLLNLRICD